MSQPPRIGQCDTPRVRRRRAPGRGKRRCSASWGLAAEFPSAPEVVCVPLALDLRVLAALGGELGAERYVVGFQRLDGPEMSSQPSSLAHSYPRRCAARAVRVSVATRAKCATPGTH